MSEAQKLAVSNPQKDFVAAKKEGRVQFQGVRGFIIEVPGVEGDALKYLKRLPVHEIDGTSDVLGPKQNKATREKVLEYARTYNTLVLQFLKDQEKHSK